ncbi:trihelix transcription factor GTL1 isoform X1 [Fagus crenata]
MQQGEGSKSQYGEISPMMGMESEQGQLVEAASPISSRPPASAAVNLDELMPLQGGGVATDEDALAVVAGDEADRAGTVGGGNRWPRQETLTLLRIRSEMDAAFRDATLKGPLWEDVSRKLSELGYKRSAKKCKEKFENVHKYYKRTKEGRAGRQDGKSYKFFSELEALHSSSATSSSNASAFLVLPPPATTTNPAVVAPVSSTSGIGIMSNPMPVSSVRVPQAPPSPPGIGMFPPDPSAAAVTTPSVYGSGIVPPPALVRTTSQLPTGISFSSNSSSSSPGTDDDDDNDDDEEEEESLEGEPSNVGSSRKRKRRSKAGSSGTRRMMQFFENLMKQVMHKQKVMQERFLEAIEKREHDRMIREEAWKRQEMARLAREHELMAEDRAISASRDAAIVTFLQNITGQTIQLPTPVTVPVAPPPPMSQAPIPTPTPPAPTPPPPSQSQRQQQVHHQSHNAQIVMAVPEQQVAPQPQDIIISGGGGGSFEPTSSSRWPKPEVLALIKLRSGLEPRYQEAGPKGPLWEEISAGMQRMGYKRSSKRCKEKWENINKYYKKVKESNKKRPEDAKTCPYFHQLDALYRRKILGGSSSTTGGSTFVNQNMPEQQQQQQQQETIKMDPISSTKPSPPQDTSDAPAAIMPQQTLTSTAPSENKNGASSTDVQAQASNVGHFGEGSIGGAPKKPEDIVKELMEHQRQQQLIVDDYDKIEEAESDNIDQEEEEEEEEDEDIEDEDEELKEERKMSYKIEFQRQNAGSSNGGGNGAASFLALVQ